MTTTKDKAKKSIWIRSFKKYVPVDNKENGKEFFDEVHVQFSFLFIGAPLLAFPNSHVHDHGFF